MLWSVPPVCVCVYLLFCRESHTVCILFSVMSRFSYLYSQTQTSIQTPLVVCVLSDSTFCSVIVSTVMTRMMKVTMLFVTAQVASPLRKCVFLFVVFSGSYLSSLLFYFLCRRSFSIYLYIYLPATVSISLWGEPYLGGGGGGGVWSVCALIHDVTCVPGAQQGALFLAAAPDNWCWFPHPQIVNLKNQLTREPHLALWCSARRQQAHNNDDAILSFTLGKYK